MTQLRLHPLLLRVIGLLNITSFSSSLWCSPRDYIDFDMFLWAKKSTKKTRMGASCDLQNFFSLRLHGVASRCSAGNRPMSCCGDVYSRRQHGDGARRPEESRIQGS